MVRVQVVTDIRVHTGPCAESLKLTLGLGHVTVEEGEVADILGPHLGVRVDGVEPLVTAGDQVSSASDVASPSANCTTHCSTQQTNPRSAASLLNSW